mmetsp:Transcript_46367/g.68444  ORF Transcript_46367/g.68444 Transcript_46367/m.68444 type:complete len:125 (-) Transcript_46367:1192-1566(-)
MVSPFIRCFIWIRLWRSFRFVFVMETGTELASTETGCHLQFDCACRAHISCICLPGEIISKCGSTSSVGISSPGGTVLPRALFGSGGAMGMEGGGFPPHNCPIAKAYGRRDLSHRAEWCTKGLQ